MERVPLYAGLVRPHGVSDHVGARICGMEEEVWDAGEAVAEEECAAFKPGFPKSRGRSCWVGALANVVLQVSQSVQRLNLMVQLVKPGKLEFHHSMEEHMLHHHHHVVNEVVGVAT